MDAQVISLSSSLAFPVNETFVNYFDTCWILSPIKPIRLSEFNKPLRSGYILLNLKINNEVFETKLTETSLLAEKYQSYIIQAGVKIPIEQKEVMPLEGYLIDQPQSAVRLTIGEDYLYGYIERDGKRFFIEPAGRYDTLYENQYVYYEEGQLSGEFTGSCEAGETSSDLPEYIDSLTAAGLRRIGNCYIIDLSVLSAPSMNSKFADVPAFVISNMNLVQGLYTNSFADNIQFNIVEHIQLQTNNPAWVTDSSSSNLLNNFSAWANAGFQAANDLGQFWSGIDWVGTSIGLAWVGTLCNPNNRQHVLSATWGMFNPSAAALRTLSAHEIGHNFNASHDVGGTNIMAPSVNAVDPSITWSANSKNSIDALISSRAHYAPNCMDACNPTAVPVSEFSTYSTIVCVGSSASFIDLSSNNPDAWIWSFPGATMTSSTQQFSGAQYNSTGQYTVSLKASNVLGDGNTVTKTNYINVISGSSGSYCMATGTPGTGGITQVNINGTLFNSGLANEDGSRFLNFTCFNPVVLDPVNATTVTLLVGNCALSRYEQFRAYIDYNNDDDFVDANEIILSSDTFYCGNITRSFVPPQEIALGQKLRMRIILSVFPLPISGPCYNPANGQVEDYAVQFGAAALSIMNVNLQVWKKSNSSIRLQGLVSNIRGIEKIDLERGQNLSDYQVISHRIINGSPVDLYQFEYEDLGLAAGNYFYRLKLHEMDGRVIYSDVVKIELWNQSSYVLYQWTNGEWILEFKEIAEKQIRLINLQGQVLSSVKFIGHSLVIPTNMLPTGPYYLQIFQDNDRVLEKIMKW